MEIVEDCSSRQIFKLFENYCFSHLDDMANSFF